jgi:hypothetical protein
MKLSNLLNQPVEWIKTENSEFPYKTNYQNHTYLIRINDFPEEMLYSLIYEPSNSEFSFEEWPELWHRP